MRRVHGANRIVSWLSLFVCTSALAGLAQTRTQPEQETRLDPSYWATVKRAGVNLGPDPLLQRLLAEYGALFVARGAGLVLPPSPLFETEASLKEFWQRLPIVRLRVGTTEVELQKPAATALQEALAEARKSGVKISPRGGASAAKRSYREALTFWRQRVENGLRHWVVKGRLTKKRAAEIRALDPPGQARAILEEEKKGLFFGTRLDGTILHSVAPPGGSQHHSLLAFDIEEYGQSRVRRILARHGWFPTVVGDLPHMTYLGLAEADLAKAGLESVRSGGRLYWVPRRQHERDARWRVTPEGSSATRERADP